MVKRMTPLAPSGLRCLLLFSVLLMTASFYFPAQASEKGTVNLVVNDLLLPEIQTEVNRLQSDMQNEGYQVLIKTWGTSDGGTEQLWTYFKSRYLVGGISGAVLIGNIPLARNTNTNQITDMVYWNMLPDVYDGTVAATSMDTYYLSRSNIWVSRMYAQGSENYGDEVTLLRRTLQQNHDYRTGASRLPHRAYEFAFSYYGDGSDALGLAARALAVWPEAEYLDPLSAWRKGGEVMHETSHGGPGAYGLSKNVTRYSIHENLAQCRFASVTSCVSGALGGVVNQQIFTRGGGNIFSVGATASTYVFAFTFLENTSFLELLASGETWGQAMVSKFPFNDRYRAMIYGDLSLPVMAAPANALPVVDSFSASVTSGATPLTVSFSGSASDSDGSVSLYEWFLRGHQAGTVEPTTARSTPGSVTHTYQLAHCYLASLEVVDNYKARASKQIEIRVAPQAGKALLVNCGTLNSSTEGGKYYSPGHDYTDVSGRLWLHEQVYAEGTWGWSSYSQHQKYPTSRDLAGVDDELYRTYRYDYYTSGFTYNVPLANGTYTVKLGFCDTQNTVAGKRLTDVSLEGQSAVTGLDIVATAGADMPLVLTRSVTVSDGILNILVNTNANSPAESTGKGLLNCFEVIPAGGTVNTAPVASSGSAGTAENQSVALRLTASDADGDSLTYTIVNAPDHGVLSGSGAGRTYTPDAGFSGSDYFTFKVNDGRADSNTATFSVTVTPDSGNSSPVIDSAMPASPYSMYVGDQEVFEVYASDADGDTLSYSWKLDGAVAPITGSSMNYSPSVADLGAHTIAVTASDGNGGSVLCSWAVTVLSKDPGGQVTVVLQDGLNGYSGTQDSYTYGYSSTHQQLNFGAQTFLQSRPDVAWFVSFARFAVYELEGGPVPDGAQIVSAKLELYRSTSYSGDYQVNRVLRDWKESEITWQKANANTSWTSGAASGAGTDIVSTADCNVSTGLVSGWIGFDVTVPAKGSNYGWRIYRSAGSNTSKYHSSEYADDTKLRPKLTITYSGETNNPPVISENYPGQSQTMTVGEGQGFGVTASDPDGDALSYCWTLDGVDAGCGSSSYDFNATAAHIGGSRILTVTVTDGAGGKAAFSWDVVVLQGNQAPVAVVTATPQSGTTPLSVVLQGGNSTDSDGLILSYDWNFGDGSTGSGAQVTHLYTVAGTYQAMLTVTDDAGATDSASVSIAVTGSGLQKTVVLQDGLNGYSGTQDSYTYGFSSAHQQINYGSSTVMKTWPGVINFMSFTRFAIYESEGGPVPDGAQIVSAKLELYRKTIYSGDYQVNRLLRDWKESEITWQKASASTSWTSGAASGAGTDIVATADSSVTTGWGTGWVGFDVTVPAKGSNFGWRIYRATGSNINQYHSSEYADDTKLRPKLTITYTESSTPPTVILQDGLNGYTGTQDSYTYGFSSAHQQINYGTSTVLKSWPGVTNLVSFVRFAVYQSEGGPVPDGAQITSARLELYRKTGYSGDYQVNRLLRDWKESEITWQKASASTSWTSGAASGAGTDIVATADCQLTTGWTSGWIGFDVTVPVKGSNFGWRIYRSTGSNINQYHSSEYAEDTKLRPKLTITYK
jgi:PKD repeat protein